MITAKFKFHDEECTADVINAGEYDNAFILYVEDCFSPPMFIVEADNEQDALDAFTDSDYGHMIAVDEVDADDYNEDDRTYAGNASTHVDTESLQIHSRKLENILYFGTSSEGYDLPVDGVRASEFRAWIDRRDEIKRDREFSIAGGYESLRYRFKDQPIYMYYVYDKWLIDDDNDMDDDGIVSVPIDDCDREAFPELAGVDVVRFRYSADLITFLP